MIPNAFFDDAMNQLSDKALRCYLIITRKTTGWGKEHDAISISQFMQFSGIKDQRTVRTGLKELEEAGLILSKTISGRATVYTLKHNEPLTSDVPTPLTSHVPTFDAPPDISCSEPLTSHVPDPLHEMSPTKETNTKTNNNNKRIKRKNIKKKTAKELLLDVGVEGELANDFIEHRKTKKAPITKTALDGFQREATKAGVSIHDAVRISIERGWQGFNADWIKPTATQVVNVQGRGNTTPLDRTINNLQSWLADEELA